ncbi:MAG: hypothetical protein U0746_07335 [Gemmataceae bacterium]
MPPEVSGIVDAAGFRRLHLNLALFAIDADGKLLRSKIPDIRPPSFRFDPEAQGRDFQRQLEEMLSGLPLAKTAKSDSVRMVLPDVVGDGRPAGIRIYLTFAKNRLNHYRTPTVEAVLWTETMATALRYADKPRSIAVADLRPVLEQLYPPAIMDGHGGCRRIDGDLTLTPAGSDGDKRYAIVKGKVAIELDNENRTRYNGPLSLVVTYSTDDTAPKSLRGVGTWDFPKHNPQGQVVETIAMTAAIESRPE